MQKGASMRYGNKLNTHYLSPSPSLSLPPSLPLSVICRLLSFITFKLRPRRVATRNCSAISSVINNESPDK